MIESSGFFDSLPGVDMKNYDAGQMAIPFKYLIKNGIFYGGPSLQVLASPSAMTLFVAPGVAFIQGRFYRLTDNNTTTEPYLTLHVPPAESAAYIGRVVLRMENYQVEGSRKIECIFKKGVESGNPVPLDLERNEDDSVWELCLADVLIHPTTTVIQQSQITDRRLDSNLCGVADFAPNPKIIIGDALLDAEEISYSGLIAGVANVKAALDALFTFAGDGKAAIAGALKSPASTADTFAQLAGRIDTVNTTLATNLAAKGVAASASEASLALAQKVSQVPTGASSLDMRSIIASGTINIPSNAISMDIFLVGGGDGADETTTQADGGKIRVVRNIPIVSTARTLSVIIGAAGTNGYPGTRTLGGNTSIAYNGSTYSSNSNPTIKTMWGITNGVRIADRAGIDLYNQGTNAYFRTGAFTISAGSVFSVNAAPNYGGGGLHYAASYRPQPGSGRAEIIFLLK